MDPRNYQIVALSAFILVGTTQLGFQIEFVNAVAIVCTALLAQRCLFSPGQAKSALISSLSLVLLLRTDVVLVAVIAALVAIASKKFLRLYGSHLFNPSAFALVVVTLVSSHGYISPGQWGALGLTAFAVIGMGLLVVTRAQRLDVALSFLLCYAAVVFLRGVYLGDPAAIAIHQLQNGALLLFSFFMITDPKTTPFNFYQRIAFGVAVALLTAIMQFYFYLSSAPIYALVVLAPLVPVLNMYSRKINHVKKITNTKEIGPNGRIAKSFRVQ